MARHPTVNLAEKVSGCASVGPLHVCCAMSTDLLTTMRARLDETDAAIDFTQVCACDCCSLPCAPRFSLGGKPWRAGLCVAPVCALTGLVGLPRPQSKLKRLNEDIVKAAKLLPRVNRRATDADGQPLDAIAVLAQEIDALEFSRGTSSLSLADERDLVRKVNALRKQQAQYAEFNGYKAERRQLGDVLDDLMAQRVELREGLRTSLVTQRLKVLNPGVVFVFADVRSEEVTVNASVIGRIVGKGGATRSAIEKECGVLIDILDRKPRVASKEEEEKEKEKGEKAQTGSEGDKPVPTTVLKITGLATGVTIARGRIDELLSLAEETLELESGLANLLIARSGAGVKQLEADTGVRATLLRVEKKVTLFGTSRVVNEAKAWIAAVQDMRVAMSIPVLVLPAVIGQAGSNFRRLQDKHSVEIEVKKPEGVTLAGYAVTIWGVEPAALEAARIELQRDIIANTKKTVALAMDPLMVNYWMANSGARLKAFQKAHNVYINLRRPGSGRTSAEDVVIPAGAQSWVEIRGVPAGLDAATAAYKEAAAEFAKTNFCIAVSPGQARTVLGKGGENVRKLRAELGVSIDVEVGEGTPMGRGRSVSVTRGRSVARAPSVGPAGGDGAEPGAAAPIVITTARYRSNLLDLPAGHAAVIIRAPDVDKLNAARLAIEALLESFRSVELTVPEATVVALVKKGGEVISKLSVDSGATIDIDRDAMKVQVSGVAEAVAAATAVIEELIACNYSVTVPYQDVDMAGALVGRKGENIRKLQDGADVAIDVEKRKNKVVIRGKQEFVDVVATRVREFIDKYQRENKTLVVDPESIPALIGRAGATIRKLQVRVCVALYAFPLIAQLSRFCAVGCCAVYHFHVH